jgi:hypothetical protein
MKIEQIYTGCIAQAAYYIENNGEAAIIDPLREVQPYLDRAAKDHAKIKYIFETNKNNLIKRWNNSLLLIIIGIVVWIVLLLWKLSIIYKLFRIGMSSLSLTLHLISHKYHLLWLVSLVNYWLSNSYWLLDYF